jgi:Beta-propeller repeat/Abnormal spindle-like microcephaly-assoc'd, ASPM-SPD-2-Hydin
VRFKALLVIVVLLVTWPIPVINGPLKIGAAHGQLTRQTNGSRYDIERAYGQLPMSFEVIPGAREGEANAIAKSRGFNLFLVGSDAIMAVEKGDPKKTQFVQMRVLGGNPRPKTSGIGRLGRRSNYLIGSDPNDWRIGIPNFERVLLSNVYPGIDLTYYGQQGNLECDFVVAPRSDPRRIQLLFEGARQLSLDYGDLVLHMGEGELHLHEPVVYQVRDGKKVSVSGRFALASHNVVSFEIGSYDPQRALVIDPGLVYSSYLGGSGRDGALGIAVGRDGSAYVTGSTESIDFPVSTSGLQKAIGHSHSTVFVTKLNRSGSAIEYSTYLGGSQQNVGTAIAVNEDGEAYVTGSTYSADFPVTTGTLQPHNAGDKDAFIAKLSADGSNLLYSTYLGGSGEDEARGLALDGNGNAFIAGFTRSKDFPASRLPNRVNCGARPCREAFVAHIDATATAVDYATSIGGSGDISANSIALDVTGSAYITGETSARDFPASKGAFQNHASEHSACVADWQCADVFVAKLSSQGSVLYATYVGGRGDQHGNAIAVDDKGSAYVTGRTDSENFPTTSGVSRDTASSHSTTAFVFKLDPLGSKLDFSTFLGGYQEDDGKAIALDAARHVYVAGWTSSSLFPTTADAFQNQLNGKSAGFVSQLDERGAKLEYSSLIGGSGSDVANAVALDIAGNIYVAGSTDSVDFPLRIAVQGSLAGERNAFVAKFSSNSTTIGQVSPPAVTAGPIVTLSPTVLQFLNQKPGTSSSSQKVTLTNSGTASLTNIVITVVGANPADFTVTTSPSNNCGGTLPASASCTLTVTFKAATTGVRLATINIADNAANSPQSVALTGNPPIASVSTASVSFASRPEGSLSPYQTVTLKNTGAYSSLNVSGISLSASNFQQANNCPATLAANASCSVTVAFMPSATGRLVANLTFSDNAFNDAASKQSVALSGTATSAPVASLSATSINFGTLPQGTRSGVRSITLTNTGVGTLTFSNIVLTAADSFILSTGSGACSATPSLKAGASCTISVTFYANPGIQTSTILITDNSGNLSGNVQEISLVGAGTTGTNDGQFSATLLNFGSVQMGSTGVQKVVQFKNTGTLPLSFSATSLFTADYYDYQVHPASSNGCGIITLAVGASCNILIIFNPGLGSPGLRTATASITVAAPYFTKAIYLIGTATGQAIPTLSSTGFTFGTVQVGSTSAAQTIVLKNTGNEPLTTGGLNMSGADFAVVSASTNNCSSTGGTNLLPGASCNISVVFQPKSAGTLGEVLTLFPGNTTQLYIALTGTGQSTTPGPIVTISANTLHFGNQQAGTVSAVQAITLTNAGTIPWYISTFSSGGYVMESPCNNYVNPGGSCVVNVYFVPTTLGPQPYYASLQVLTSTTSSNLTLVFTGTGIGNQAARLSTTNLKLGTATSGSLGGTGVVTFTNSGNVPYPFNVRLNELNPIGIGSPLDFQQTNNCQFGGSGMMPVGESCTALVTFTPAVGPAGTREALLTFQEGGLLQQNVIITGKATGTPVLSVSPLSFTFLDQTQGTSSSALAISISNTGTAPLPFNVLSGGGEFPFLSYNCPATLQQGTSCMAYFTFNPSPNPSFGPRFSSVVVFATTGLVSQQLVPLSGFGTPPH